MEVSSTVLKRFLKSFCFMRQTRRYSNRSPRCCIHRASHGSIEFVISSDLSTPPLPSDYAPFHAAPLSDISILAVPMSFLLPTPI